MKKGIPIVVMTARSECQKEGEKHRNRTTKNPRLILYERVPKEKKKGFPLGKRRKRSRV